ncbi:retrovirus-related pol polyprotein from transposon TNT 1-94 [Tanacetum coccineum]|uniref:Retrovirus-related pol polyprotein from transposon TNT 1-94 n=1 Tax=Tanacetum coccineum TaxID=301880 RepID=A0ABQ5HUP0_9ASTR
MRLNDDLEAVRNQILSMNPLPNLNEAYYIVQQVEKQNCPYMTKETPFDFEYENGVNNGKIDLDQRMVTTICQEMMKMFKGKAIDQSNDTSTSKPHVAYIANHFNAKPKFIRSDNGTEIVNGECLAYLRKQGIVHQKSMVYTSQQNATVERKHKHLLDTARALKFHSGLPNKFWGDCMLTTTYLINKMPMKILDWKTPFEMLHGVHPSYDHLRVIGCLSFAM